LSLSGCGDGEQQAAQPPKGRPPTPVQVVPIARETVQQSVTLVGVVEPWKRSLVAGEIAGLVETLPVEEGMKIQRGGLLARLRTDTLTIRLQSALASLRESDARHKQANQDLQRIKILFGKELVTQKEYDDATAQELALRQRSTQLQTDILQVRDQLSKSRIVAPFTGWITKKSTEVGQWVKSGDAVVEMVDLSRVQIEVPFPERYIRDIHPHNPVTAVFDALPEFKAPGHVLSVVAQADTATRTFPVKVELPNPHVTMKSGMVARVTFHIGVPTQGFMVPKDALVLRGGQTFVFLVKDGLAVQIPVHTGIQLTDRVQIIGKLGENLPVVVEGNERLHAGQPVRILKEGGKEAKNS